MIGAQTLPAGCAHYELEIAIDASRERVWEAIISETNAWWLPDFHMVGEGSTVHFDTRAGGTGLVESKEDGGNLLWYSVHSFQPEQFTIYLVGHIARDFGGPSTSHLKISVEADANGGSLVKVSDSHQGHVDEQNLNSLNEGWTQLFTEGLKAFVETGTRHDG